MAVLHIAQYSLPSISSGYTIRTQAIAREQQALGLEPAVLTSPRHPSSQDERVEGIMHYRCRPESGRGSVWLRDAARVRELAARIEEVVAARGDVQLLHAHSPVLCGTAALGAGRGLGLPVVYEIRGLWEEAAVRGAPWRRWMPRYRIARAWETRVCRAADAVVALSDGLRREFLARGVAEDRIHIVPNGVDPRVFHPREGVASWRAAHGLSEGPVILYMGALRNYEGVDLLIEAYSKVQEHHPTAQLLIVGDGEAKERIRERVQSGGAGMRLSPIVPHEETPWYYAAADVVAYPRLSDRATERVTPLKPLEAMAMGRAIVASDVGGLRELLGDSESARLFPAGSREALASALIELIEDDEGRRALGENARRAALQRYDWRAIVPGYVTIYRAVGYA